MSFDKLSPEQSAPPCDHEEGGTTPINLLDDKRSSSSDKQDDDNAQPPMCKYCATEISKLNCTLEGQRECTEKLQQDISQLKAVISNLSIAVTKLITLMEEDQCDLTSQSNSLSHHMESPALASTRPNSISIQEDESSHQDDQFNNEETIHIAPSSQEGVGKLELAVDSNLAIVPFASRSSSARSTPTPIFVIDSDELKVPCTYLCNHLDSPLLPCVQDDQVHFLTLVPRTKKGSKLPEGHIESYSLIDDKTSDNKISFVNCIKSICPIMLFYLNKITVLGSNSNVNFNTVTRLNVSLYQLIKGEWLCEWKIVDDSEFSTKVDLKNTICTAYGNDGMVVISVLNQVTGLFIGKITISLFLPSKTAGKNWCQAYVFLPELTDDLNYKIQSCLVVSNTIYCSIVLQGTAAYVYEINLTPLTQCNRETIDEDLLQNKSIIEDNNLQNCYLIALNEIVNIITFVNAYNETVMDVWPLADFTSTVMPRSQYHYGFGSIITVATASMSGSQNITVIYHGSESNNCMAKRFKLHI